MSDITKIEWTDATWGPWEGCTKVSEGCAHCYAETRNHRFGNDNWGKGKPRRKTVDWKKPLRWSKTVLCKRCSKENNPLDSGCGYPDPHTGTCDGELRNRRVFPSLCDWLDDEVPIEWTAQFLKLIRDTPNLVWQLLTKRPENFFKRLEAAQDWHYDFGCRDTAGCISDWIKHSQPPENVWIGTSVENQKCADERVPDLLRIPAKVLFLSCEPLIGAIEILDLRQAGLTKCGLNSLAGIKAQHVDWVIVGGESGPNSRSCNIEWIRSIVNQCKIANIPVFVKQLGASPHVEKWPICEREFSNFGRITNLNLKDKKGGDMSEWPADLRVREFPKVI